MRIETPKSSGVTDSIISTNLLPSTSGVADEPISPYRSLPKARFTEFRRAIEQKNEIKFEELLLENPRFLLNTNNDLPSILQEGYRFNTFHVACRTGNLYAIRRSLELLSDFDWYVFISI